MSDLKGGAPADWLVAGWFTPDYRALAEKFAANLDQHNTPYHLWARSKLIPGWSTLQKPAVALDAMNAYPGKSIVLMDVDCIVRDSIAPALRITGDVGLTVWSRRVRLLWPPNSRITIKAISRVIVFRPTAGARKFAQEWARLCKESPQNGDEDAIARIFASPILGISYSHLDPRYIGRELSDSAADSIVVHDSAHDHQRRRAGLRSLKDLGRAIERHFRTGRTKAAKQAGLT